MVGQTMSQRHSGYVREKGDLYVTPDWVVDALVPYVPRRMHVWEPAAGRGDLARALVAAGHSVHATDIDSGTDFLKTTTAPIGVEAIITNPPYGRNLAQRFIEHGLRLMKPVNGLVAMLLRVDFGTARTRHHLFRDCPIFSTKVEVIERIEWYPTAKLGRPSYNHAWFIWDHRHRGEPVIRFWDRPPQPQEGRASIWREPYAANDPVELEGLTP
ncbi:hypothetical protein [Bradyrhizobium sp. SZCCHNR3003]|uniref:hypothetical protein n=1 Tax=Bradyrhizobium sp. SZCCHNR3003 TaxID=3057387 RepID=UPI002915F0E8|nr:hypothetical protein [Bradyrhizobium sp. SZCCHNR3003]